MNMVEELERAVHEGYRKGIIAQCREGVWRYLWPLARAYAVLRRPVIALACIVGFVAYDLWPLTLWAICIAVAAAAPQVLMRMGYLRGFRRAGLAWRSVRLNTYLLRLLPAEDQKLVRARMEEAGSGANFYFESIDGLYAVFEHRYGQRHYICRGESKADAGKLVFSLGDLT